MKLKTEKRKCQVLCNETMQEVGILNKGMVKYSDANQLRRKSVYNLEGNNLLPRLSDL
jgi:hypothetical protein